MFARHVRHAGQAGLSGGCVADGTARALELAAPFAAEASSGSAAAAARSARWRRPDRVPEAEPSRAADLRACSALPGHFR